MIASRMPDAAQGCEPSVTVTVLGRVDALERGRKTP